MGSQGVSRDVAMGKLIFDVLHRQPAEALRAEFDEVFRTGRMQQFSLESNASGSRRTFRISKIPMRLEEGVVTHVMSIGEDITDWTEDQRTRFRRERIGFVFQAFNLLPALTAEQNVALRFFDGIGNTLTGQVEAPGVSLGALGNATLKPEYSAELEGGFDLAILNGRANLELESGRKHPVNSSGVVATPTAYREKPHHKEPADEHPQRAAAEQALGGS